MPDSISVKDQDGASVPVSSIEFAPWDSDDETVLVKLATATTAGKYYTLTSGSISMNFGGRATDTTLPEVTGVTSTDYNEITIDFSEPVLITGAVSAEMKYSPYSELTTSTITYESSTEIKVITSAQTGSTLYSISITDFTDLEGNIMDDDTSRLFVGTAKDTTVPEIDTASATDSTAVTVTFDVKMDGVTSIDPSNYTVKMKYSPYTEIPVVAAEEGDTEYDVDLTLGSDMSGATLYEVTAAAGVISKYSVASTSSSSATYVGKAKDTTAIESFTATATSNTEVVLTMGSDATDDALDSTVTDGMFSIKMKYSPYTELPITAVSIDDNTATLTTGAQSVVLYEVTAKTGLKDYHGNATTEELTASLAGRAVASAISAVSSVTRTVPAGSTVDVDADTQIVLDFDQNVGSNATDVSQYYIDNSIGYPIKAELVDGTGNADKVLLTIGDTTAGKVYTLTVKSTLKNSDEVAIGSDITKTFVGQGSSATLPLVQAVVATDDHTIKIYFDRDVSGSDVSGKIYSSNAILPGKLQYRKNSGTYSDLSLLGGYAYQDSQEACALVLRCATAVFDTSVDTLFYLKNANTNYLDDDFDELLFAGNATDAAAPEIVAAAAVDNRTILVYFSSPIDDYDFAASSGGFEIRSTETGASVITVNRVVTVDSMTLRLSTASSMSSTTYYLYIPTTGTITDISGTLPLSDENPSDATGYAAVQFAGSGTAPSDISDIAVMMTDSRTIEVYFPVAMDGGEPSETGNASNISYYELYNDDGDTPSSVQPVAALYDSTNKKVKLILNEALTSGSVKYVAVKGGSTGLCDEGRVTYVDDESTGLAGSFTSGVIRQFAVNTTSPTEPEISSAVMSSDNTQMTLTFNMAVAFGNSTAAGTPSYLTNLDVVGMDDFAVDGFDGSISNDLTSVFSNYFELSATDSNGAVTVPLSATRTSNTKVVLTFARPLLAGTQGTIAIKESLPAANTIYSMSKIAADTDGQSLTFGVASPLGDVTAPVLVSKAYYDTNSNGKIDSIVLTFNESVLASSVAATDFTIGAGADLTSQITSGNPANVVVASNVITLSVTELLDATYTDDTISWASGAFTDAAGNGVAVLSAATMSDNAAPVISGVVEGVTYGPSAAATFTEGTATLNGVAYTSSTAITVDGTYTLIVTDTALNSTTINFVVDATAPVAFAVDQPTSADDGTNGNNLSNVIITWTDSTATDVDHYIVVAKTGSVPAETDIVVANVNVGVQTATFTYTSGADCYVGVYAVDTVGNATVVYTNATPNVTVVADTP